jgi:hypothetical protein
VNEGHSDELSNNGRILSDIDPRAQFVRYAKASAVGDPVLPGRRRVPSGCHAEFFELLKLEKIGF